MNRPLRIGEVAKQVGLNPKTIRYYEEIGLLPKPKRSQVIHGNGYRLYTQEDLNQLAFIKRAKLLDLSLAQIKDLLASVEEGCCGSAQPHLAVLLEQKLAEIEERIRELKQLRQHLIHLKQETAQAAQAPKLLSSCVSTASPSDCVFVEFSTKTQDKPQKGVKRDVEPKAFFGDSKTKEKGQELKPAPQADGCCEPLCPDACGPAGGQAIESPVMVKEKVVQLTKAGAQRLFNGEDDEIFTHEDLIETQPDGTVKVTGACSGTVWLVRRKEILAILDG